MKTPQEMFDAFAARIARRVYPVANKRLPNTRLGDRTCAFLDFVRIHGRLPREQMLFSDFLYHLKVSGELLSLPRQIVSDKEYCKAFVDSIIVPRRTIPTLFVLRRKDELESAVFPARCVIKPTHLSGRVIFRSTGEPIDAMEMASWFDESLADRNRETNYRHLVPKVIVEPVVFDGDMIEMKIHCWKGRVGLVSLRPNEPMTIERRDRDWNMLAIKGLRRTAPSTPTPRPACFDGIVEAAEALASHFDYIRVDVYVSGSEFLIGELTNLHRNIRQRFATREDEMAFSEAIFGDDALRTLR